MPSYAFPPPPPSIEPTPLDRVDALVERLASKKGAWARTSIDERLVYLDKLGTALLAASERWVAATQKGKGLPSEGPLGGEAWLEGPMVTIRNVRLLRRSLEAVRDQGQPKVSPDRITRRADGRTVVRVFPEDTYDGLMFSGFSAEVWMQPGVTPENLAENQASHYKRDPGEGAVSLVLGAGNISSIAPMDAIYKLFVEGEVVVLKMNPVNEYVGPIMEEAFKALSDDGYFGVVYGAAEQGIHLCNHPRVDTIHITGSDATHDAIVWGPAEGRAERKAAGERANTRPISSELGNVTPIIVVPGPWSEKDLQFQAENVATMVSNNASFNCNAGKLLVVPRDWELRDAFLDKVRAVLRGTPNRKAYYPGAQDRWRTFIEAHPEAEQLSSPLEGTVPWTLIPGLDHTSDDEICFTTEPFCGVLHEVALPGATATEFLPAAVDFCNDKVWGTLSVMILIHPSTRKDAAAEAAFQEALDDLRYGSIGVNHWAGVIYGLSSTTWGAYPGHTLEDIQSGRGVVHNTWLFDKPQKSVLFGPFRVFPKPVWFLTNRRTHVLGRKVTHFEASPSMFKLVSIVFDAIQG
jgi:hypothetical protein